MSATLILVPRMLFREPLEFRVAAQQPFADFLQDVGALLEELLPRSHEVPQHGLVLIPQRVQGNDLARDAPRGSPRIRVKAGDVDSHLGSVSVRRVC